MMSSICLFPAHKYSYAKTLDMSENAGIQQFETGPYSLFTLKIARLRRRYDEAILEENLDRRFWRSEADGPHPWTGFVPTDPAHHNPRDFIYLVHGIRPYRFPNPQTAIDRFSHKPTVSMSLIFPCHRETFYRFGFILDVPPTNIVCARPRDSATAILDDESTQDDVNNAIAEAIEAWGVLSPEELCQFSIAEGFEIGGQKHNEVYALTGFNGCPVPTVGISGVFTRNCEPDYRRIAREWSRMLEVPLVDLQR